MSFYPIIHDILGALATDGTLPASEIALSSSDQERFTSALGTVWFAERAVFVQLAVTALRMKQDGLTAFAKQLLAMARLGLRTQRVESGSMIARRSNGLQPGLGGVSLRRARGASSGL